MMPILVKGDDESKGEDRSNKIIFNNYSPLNKKLTCKLTSIVNIVGNIHRA